MRILAREIACDIYPIETILKRHNIGADQWQTIQNSKYFQNVLQEERRHWEGLPNTAERVKAKYLVMVEEAAEFIFESLADKQASLASRNELLKTVARIGGVGVAAGGEGGGGERITIKINMGADAQLRVEKASQVIEHEASE